MNLESYYANWAEWLSEKAIDAAFDSFDDAATIDAKAQLIWDKAMNAARYGA